MKKIVLIGDSIREGYQKYVKMAFEGIAEVFSPDENCRFSAYVLRNLIDWKERMGCGDDVDCVHWNAGLWDALVLSESIDCDPDGINLVPVEIYEYYIDKICIAIRLCRSVTSFSDCSKAALICCSANAIIKLLMS